MQHKTSLKYKQLIDSGLSEKWVRCYTAAEEDGNCSVVCFSDDSIWFFDNGTSEQVQVVGRLHEGSQLDDVVVQTSIGVIIALYGNGAEVEMYGSYEGWVNSLSEAIKLANPWIMQEWEARYS